MYPRMHARIIWVGLLVVGVVGLVVGDHVWLGILNSTSIEDTAHLITDGL